MNLGQSMFAIAALSLIGYLALSSNRNIASAQEDVNRGEFGTTAVSLATSVIEEAMGKMFDANIEDSLLAPVKNTGHLTHNHNLGPDAGEAYHVPGKDFNDFDDFNNLFLVFKSSNPADTVSTPGSNRETIVPNLRSKYYIRTKVGYVHLNHLDDVSPARTWHKKITVTVINATTQDSLVYPAIMSYWN
jgi:hypothetical protein